jgi:hypothetical protein
MGSNPYFFQFIKQRKRNLPEGELYRACVTLLELIKPERGTHLSGWGGKIERSKPSSFLEVY